MLARNKDRAYMLTATVGALVNVGANLLVIPWVGMLGAAITTLMAECVVLGAILWQTRDLSFGVLAAALRRAAPPTLVMSAAIVVYRDNILAVPLGALVFVLAALASRAVRTAEIVAVARRLMGDRPPSIENLP
jgi:O-antigen/teichoic acid export membrane protein